ncbi:hypothetical protein PP707_02690 [Acetobacter pasteurianus]|nr:hypothetical protein [Acetobacter pasteurianus]
MNIPIELYSTTTGLRKNSTLLNCEDIPLNILVCKRMCSLSIKLHHHPKLAGQKRN